MKERIGSLSLATKALLLLVGVFSSVVAIELAVLDDGDMLDAGEAGVEDVGEFLVDSSTVNPPRSPPLSDYGEITERPLFNETRRPIAAEVAPTVIARAASQLSQQWKLTGVVMAGDNTFAHVENKRDRRTVRLRKDDRLDGWRLDEISADRISLVSDKGSVSLELHEEDLEKE